MKILLVHGIGHCELDPGYYQKWQEVISAHLKRAGAIREPEYHGLLFDAIFDRYPRTGLVYLKALGELAAAGIWHSIADPIDEMMDPSRDLGESLRWKAGMVAQLCVHEKLRRELRNLLFSTLTAFEPDLIVAHSLGSLVTYDFLRKDARASSVTANATYLTFGSQLNNAFARGKLFPGPLKRLHVKFWYHLYNRQDPVLTAPITLGDRQFLQVTTTSAAGHNPIGTADNPGYLNHPQTFAKVWRAIASTTGARVFRRALTAARRSAPKPGRRALLIGINEYPQVEARLEGCVNDTFLMSSLLQERGFKAEDIRVVLDSRATAQAIRERLGWLLEGADSGSERVLFFSGHGAQMPEYNAAEKIDHVDECLVPWNFAWTKETAITDDDLFTLYSNLPFNARFFAVFDCCHSGGIHREGGPRVRGIAPPDDLRHRMMRWDPRLQMWRERDLPALNSSFGGKKSDQTRFMGKNRATYRIGRGMRARQLPQSVYKKLPKDDRGPYLPVIIEACQESSLSYEYRDGATSYGAFTFSLAKALRERPRRSFVAAVEAAKRTLKDLNFQQVPQILGPSSVVHGRIPGK